MNRSGARKRFWILVLLFTAGLLFAFAQTFEWAGDQTAGAATLGRLMSVLLSWVPVFALTAVYHLCLWSGPARRLARVAALVRKGQFPLEELSRLGVTGGMVELKDVLQETLTELKQQKGSIATIRDEMRQRVASKTESLERKIGTLKMQASRDSLTRLLNRRSLDGELERAVEQFRSVGTDACVLMIDVDHFKGLNDTLGHAAGDELLKSIAQIIRSSIREGDLAFRCGGDEFVVLLAGCGVKAGTAMAERLASLVAELTRTIKVRTAPTLSIGACSLAELPEPSPAAVLNTADQRLYAVKAMRPRTRKAG